MPAQKSLDTLRAFVSDSVNAKPSGVFAEPEKTLAGQAYERVLDMIMSGEARPGALFTERKLADQLAMSRTPLRDALLMLESEGLLNRLGIRGVQIATMRIEEYAENLAVRRLLEPEAARIAAGRMPAPVLERLKQGFENLLAAHDAGRPVDRSEVRDADEDLHTAIAEVAGNAKLSAIVCALRRQTLVFDLRSMPERFDDTCREHLAIVAALSREGEASAQAMREHLDAVRASIFARLARL